MNPQDVLSAHLGRANVLIVDSDPVAAEMLGRHLEAMGIAWDSVPTPDQALHLQRERRRGVIFCAWDSASANPGINSLELCTACRELDGSYTYFILYGPKPSSSARKEAFDSGADEILLRPIDGEELATRMRVARRILRVEAELNRESASSQVMSERLAQANANLTWASYRFSELFNGLPIGCFTFDESGLIHEWNRSAEALFGVESHVAFQNPVWESLGGSNGPWKPHRVAQILESGGPIEFDWTFVDRSRSERFFACNLMVLRDTTGQVVGAMSANVDVTARKLSEKKLADIAAELEMQRAALIEANTRLSHLATTDGLTSLLNHRQFQVSLESTISSFKRTGADASLIIIDIDRFKSVNDEFGHQAGDEILKQFASILLTIAPSRATVCRYGGEEFALVLPDCSADAAMQCAEVLRHAVETERWQVRDITASFGVATTSPSIAGGKHLVEAADKALYACKQAGRNRCCHFADLPDSLPDAAHTAA